MLSIILAIHCALKPSSRRATPSVPTSRTSTASAHLDDCSPTSSTIHPPTEARGVLINPDQIMSPPCHVSLWVGENPSFLPLTYRAGVCFGSVYLAHFVSFFLPLPLTGTHTLSKLLKHSKPVLVSSPVTSGPASHGCPCLRGGVPGPLAQALHPFTLFEFSTLHLAPSGCFIYFNASLFFL